MASSRPRQTLSNKKGEKKSRCEMKSESSDAIVSFQIITACFAQLHCLAIAAGGHPRRGLGRWRRGEPGREAPVLERVARSKPGLLLTLAVRAALVEVTRVAEGVVLEVPGPATRVPARPEALALCFDPRRRRPDQRRGRRAVCVPVPVPVPVSVSEAADAVRDGGRRCRGRAETAGKAANVAGHGRDLDIQVVEVRSPVLSVAMAMVRLGRGISHGVSWFLFLAKHV
jgi:hypothetical protein